MPVRIVNGAFDPLAEVRDYQQASLRAGQFGANAVFIGTMRDFNDGDPVSGMQLEYYPGMTEKHLQRICDSAGQRWALLDCLVTHRVGTITPGEPIVVVSVWSAHRGDACDACRHIIEDLKQNAPFWKKEMLENGARWVEHNTDGYQGKTG